MKELRERTRVVISSQDMEQKITTLRERAILLFQESPQKHRSELINIGLELIHIDPLLHEYKASLDTDQDQMIRLIRTGAFMNLIEEDITGLIIAPNDRTIAVPGGKISGFSLIKLYLVRLQDKLSNLGQNSIDVLKVPYLNGSGVESELCLLASKNASDDFDDKLLQILKEPPIPEYMVTCIEECLKPLSDLIIRRNRMTCSEPDFTGILSSNWDGEVKSELAGCQTKHEVLKLILKYTQKGSKNSEVGGLGEDGASNPEYTYKLSRLMIHFWTKIIDHDERCSLMQIPDFPYFFEIVTAQGTSFGNGKVRYYAPYSTNSTTMTCLDLAQGSLSRRIEQARSVFKHPSSVKWGFEVDDKQQIAIELDRITHKIKSLTSILQSKLLDNALKYGCKIIETNGEYELKSIHAAAIAGNRADLIDLCGHISVTTRLFRSLENERLSPDILGLLIRSSTWSEHHDLNGLIKYALRTQQEPPLLVLKYYCHRLPDVVDREEFNTLLKTFTKIDPDSDSVFNNQLIWDILATKKPLDTIDIVPSGLGVTDQSSAKGPTNLEIFLGINTLEDINNFSRKDLRARQDRLIEGLLACLLAIFPQNKHDQIKDEHVKCFFVDSSYPRFHQALINLQCDRSILDRIQNEYNRLNSCITGSSKLSIEQTLSQEFKSKQGILHNVNLRKAEQRILIRRYELPFNNLLATLKIKTDELIRKGTQGSHEYNAKYDEVKIAAETLNQELKQAKDHFFNNITPENFEDFKNTCTLAIDKAEIEFVKQRGWHGIHFVLKGILAVLAALTIIPALIVVAKSQHGLLHECKRSFFSTPMTDSAEKLQLLKNSLLDDKDGIFQMIQVSVSG